VIPQLASKSLSHDSEQTELKRGRSHARSRRIRASPISSYLEKGLRASLPKSDTLCVDIIAVESKCVARQGPSLVLSRAYLRLMERPDVHIAQVEEDGEGELVALQDLGVETFWAGGLWRRTPNDCPALMTFRVVSGLSEYLDWIHDSSKYEGMK